MNVVDIIIIIFAIYGAYKGFSKGLLIEIADLIGLFLGGYLAFRFQHQVGDYVLKIIPQVGSYSNFIAWILIFIITVILLSVIANGLTKLADSLALGLLNKIVGVFFGILKMMVVLVILVWGTEFIRVKIKAKEPEVFQKSVGYKLLNEIGNNVYHSCEKL